MRRLLLLTYYYPPCNLAPTRRVMNWVECLPGLGWRPIVVCRHWSKEEADDPASEPLRQDFLVERHATHEVHWVPYRPTPRDLVRRLAGKDRLVLLRKALTFGQLLGEKVWDALDPLDAYWECASDLVREGHVDGVLVTGNPFNLFRTGYRLHERYGIPWAADYRDSWSSNDLAYPAGIVSGVLRRADRLAEKHWLRSAAFFTSVSPEYVRSIRETVSRPGYTLYNGFVRATPPPSAPVAPESKLTVAYLGTLYPGQRIEVFLRGVLRFLQAKGPDVRFQMLFPGITYMRGQKERVAEAIRGFEQHFSLMDRISGAEATRLQTQCHLLLQVGWQTQAGIVGSKVFEYLGSGRPLVICPSDGGVLERMVADTGVGWVLSNEAEVEALVTRLYEELLATSQVQGPAPRPALQHYSRERQARRLARCLDIHFVRAASSAAGATRQPSSQSTRHRPERVGPAIGRRK